MTGRTGIIAACPALAVLGIWLVCGRSAVKEAVYPVENGRLWLGRAVGTRLGGFFHGARVAAENRRLKDENDALRMVRGEAAALAAENARLRAPVLSRGGAAGVRGLIRVGRGRADGVATNAAVAVPEGLVGRVEQVSPRTADVRLITSPSVKVACDVETGDPALGAVRGILEGGGVHAVRPEAATSILYVINPLRVRHLKRRPKLPAHARIITNGLGGIFPRGLTVGFLVDEQDEGEMELEREGDVLPAVDFPALENVFIRRED